MVPVMVESDSYFTIVVQLKPDSWRALRQLALDMDTSVQKLGIEAFTD